MTDNFEFLSKIGEGAFASVYKVMRKQDSHLYALKKLKSNHLKEKDLQNCLNEVRILASVNSPFVIRYKQAFYENSIKSLCLVTEFADGGDLANKIKKMKKNNEFFEQKQIWKIAIQLLHGIKALHSLNIFHRDIKPANILLTSDNVAKLADMNVSIITKTGLATTQTGTPYYASPQVWMEQSYNGKSDIWSLGCVLYEMAAQRPPFMASDIPLLRKKILNTEYEKIPNYSSNLNILIRSCLTKDKKMRPSADEILDSNFIKERKKTLFDEFSDNSSFTADSKQKMLQTIRLDNKNLNSLQLKLPKCAYNNSNKENITENIEKNNSWVFHKRKPNTVEKLPKIKRGGSAERRVIDSKIDKDKPPLRKKLLKVR